ncbi:MAG: hypothetical protein NTX72_02420 [Candidatus Uhrbacteria bacterium]|nr:hypothetical protein [Candidatus Uhrbacteria bacterium]
MGIRLHARSWQGIWILLSSIMILGSIAYYTATVPAILFQTIVLISSVILFWKPLHTPNVLQEELKETFTSVLTRIRFALSSPVMLATLCVLFLVGLFFHLIQAHPIINAIRSPWDQINPSFLILFALATLVISILLYRGREKTVSIGLFILLIASLFSFIAILYPIGYGFDSFIHKATEMHLAQFGTITPKPFYYIGQYSIVLFFSHAFSLPIDLVDTWLLPLLASILLPLAWFNAANIILKKPRYALLTLLGLFLLPLDAFIVTTPQGLANLWILLAILASVPWLFDEESPNWIIAGIATLSTLLIHPIAGIPLFFFFALLFFSEHHKRLSDRMRQIIIWSIVAIGSLALPASFILQSIKSGQGLHLTFGNLNPIQLIQSMNLDVFFQSRFNPLIDFVYVYGQNVFLIALLVSFGAWWMYRKELSTKMRVLFLMVIILGINYLLLANVIDFSFLIDYERANYANRLIPLLLFFASPLIILAFGHLSMNLRTKPVALKLSCLVLLTMIATASFYLTFPRRDAYTTSHAFNVSQADVDAVYLMEDWAGGKPYIALANQSVSAAAIKNLGFRYYGNLFFYPIPTGEAMYQQFLAMNTTPSRATIESALALIPKDENVHTVYYVVDTYWWQADQLIEQAKAIADDWKSVDGSVYVFRFDVK